MKYLILALALCIPIPAQAYPCWVIRQAVSEYGEAAVEAWARAHGASEKTIIQHRKCLAK